MTTLHTLHGFQTESINGRQQGKIPLPPIHDTIRLARMTSRILPSIRCGTYTKKGD